MQLWAIQNHAVWNQLKAGNVYVPRMDRIEFPASEGSAPNHQNYAYRRLARQMT